MRNVRWLYNLSFLVQSMQQDRVSRFHLHPSFDSRISLRDSSTSRKPNWNAVVDEYGSGKCSSISEEFQIEHEQNSRWTR